MPISYDHGELIAFSGLPCSTGNFESARAAILPTARGAGSGGPQMASSGAREIIWASCYMDLWDEELGVEVYRAGLFTLPEMVLPAAVEEADAQVGQVAESVLRAGKFFVTLADDQSVTPPVVAAAARRNKDLSVLHLGASLRLQDCERDTSSHTDCAMRHVLKYAPAVQVGIRRVSADEARTCEELPTRLFLARMLKNDPEWMDAVVRSLSGTVYITIDCGVFDPSIMPAVEAAEPGGLAWYEVLSLLRRTARQCNVVGADVVGLSPIPGLVSPNFLGAKLVYKLLTYCLGPALSEANR